jgi:Zn-finger nucleic acid-binding protein
MHDEVKQFLARLEKGGEATDNSTLVPHGERPCPICGNKMVVDDELGIQTDVCSAHGVWLDIDELTAIISRVRSQDRTSKAFAVREARRDGKWKGAAFGLWSFMIDD